MIVDGKVIAERIKLGLKKEIEKLPRQLKLTHFVGTDDSAIQSFVRIKRRVADELGVLVEGVDVTLLDTEEMVEKIRKEENQTDGIILQFPLPEDVDASVAKNAIPLSLDVDAISEKAIDEFKEGRLKILPPVAGAIKEIINAYKIEVVRKKVLIVGAGLLVGIPSEILFEQLGADVEIVTKGVTDLSTYSRRADIIVLGAGQPGLLSPDMINEGVIVFDAGTSEEGGKLIGDADPACASKCRFFTPVPGGIGPITIAMIFKNLLTLRRR